MKNKLKTLFLTLLSTGTLATYFAMPFHFKHTKQNSIWYENINNNKLEIRNQFMTTVLNNSGQFKNIPINNNFELKLLLNPGFETENEEFLNNFNNDFIKKVNAKDLKYQSFEKLTTMPIVWFYFKNENDRENFVNNIKDWTEIYKLIVFENKDLNSEARVMQNFEKMGYSYNPSSSQYDYNFEKYKQSVNKNANIVKATNHLNNSNINKIGIVESWAYPFHTKYQQYFKSGIEINELDREPRPRWKTHSTMVSMIAAGQYGIDRSSKVYLYTVTGNDSYWMSTIEKMVKEDGIRLINHSYGLAMFYEDEKGKQVKVEDYFNGYNENTYFLDYISRKYGVINVIAAGNDGTHDYHLISENKLSFNSVVVGALDDSASERDLRKNIVADYSNYRLLPEFKNISKPLVVAPAYFYDPVYNNNNYSHGTSYAAPVVTGLISNLFKYKSDIKNSEFRIPVVKSILSASAVSPKHDNLTYKSSGYEHKYGAGTVDFKAMLEAADNYSTLKIHPTNDSGFVFSSKEINLKKNQTIKISISWMFNAGLLNQSEVRPEYKENTSWWNSFLNFFSPSRKRSQELEKQKTIADGKMWDLTHKSEIRLTQSEAIKRQNNNWFSDYDLYLEKKESNGKWVVVKIIQSAVSNDELLEYKATSSGTYRYRIKKYEKYDFSNSVYDLIATTHVVKNE